MSQLHAYLAFATSLAWPFVVLVLIIILAAPLRRLVDGLRSIELSRGKLRLRREFRAAAKSARTAVEELKVAPRDSSADPDDGPSEVILENRNPWLAIAVTSPAIAILESWEELRAAIFDLANKTGIETSEVGKRVQVGLTETIQLLIEGKVVNPSFASAVDELRELRNKVAHGGWTPTQPEGLAFITSAWELVRASNAIAIVLRPRSTRLRTPKDPR
ncbi:MAG TPA: hypothetical protein VHZ81_11760 [Galbitalea sp.]|jgi:hypothetical protein|nr:hypothetical protein [Galbitalea sp.]